MKLRETGLSVEQGRILCGAAIQFGIDTNLMDVNVVNTAARNNKIQCKVEKATSEYVQFLIVINNAKYGFSQTREQIAETLKNAEVQS